MPENKHNFIQIIICTAALILPACTQSENVRNKETTEQDVTIAADQSASDTDNEIIENKDRYKELDQDWSLELVNNWVLKDKAKRGAEAQYIKYTYIPPNFLMSKDDTNYARIGVLKALNSVAIHAEDIHLLEDISGHGLVFAFDIRNYLSGDALTKWGWVAKGETIELGGGGFQDLAQAYRLAPFDPDAPVPADRLAYNLLHGGIYTALLDTPLRRYDLEAALNLSERTAKLAFEHSITFGIRYAERRTFELSYQDGSKRQGIYWIAFDPFDPLSGQDTSLPWLEDGGKVPNFNANGLMVDYRSNVASEGYYSMKNGLLAYYVWGSNDQRRSRADPRFVIDPLQRDDANQPLDVITGFCAHCHVSGIQGAQSDMAVAIGNSVVTNREAIDFWTSNAELMKYWNDDRRYFKEAMTKIVNGISDGTGVFNSNIVEGSDPREPMYYLSKDIGKHTGSTKALTRRRADGTIPGLVDPTLNQSKETLSDNINRKLTFAADILPILSSNSPGKRYKCTVCHSSYSDESKISHYTLDSIIDRVQLQYMPVGNEVDMLASEDIAILEAWRRQKFPKEK